MTILINEIKNLEQELENGSAAEHEFNKLKQLKNEAEQTVMELRLRVN
jgi:hypothetical protein